ncbi:MAG: SAM-dependent methyltransferase [Elusimicrobia bacterium]|nr:SAM-dependent methyltransferase [Elusimicrobiota bacterium]
MQTFRDYMDSALYDPERGYYSRRTPTQDFYTAPELHPAFAGVLAREIARRLDALAEEGVPGPYSITEMGSGSGRLAAELLRSLRQNFPRWADTVRYVLVERSRTALLDSVLALSSSAHVVGYTRLEEVLPGPGVFLSNELVDAFPVHLLEKRDGSLYEVYVEESGRTLLSDLSAEELRPFAEEIAPALSEGERHAVNLEALRWLKLVGEKLRSGFVITIDYGRRMAGAPNPPRTFFRHTTDFRLTEGKGFKDITASVDFDALISEGARLGLTVDAYETLGRFLIEGGIQDYLPEGMDTAAIRARGQVKTLLHPDGMGEAFKVLIQRKSAPASAI